MKLVLLSGTSLRIVWSSHTHDIEIGNKNDVQNSKLKTYFNTVFYLNNWPIYNEVKYYAT